MNANLNHVVPMEYVRTMSTVTCATVRMAILEYHAMKILTNANPILAYTGNVPIRSTTLPVLVMMDMRAPCVQ